MIRIITDNLLYMGIASAILSVLLLLITWISRRRLSSRLYLAGWIIALVLLLVPAYALFRTVDFRMPVSNTDFSAAQYRDAYSKNMERSILRVFGTGTGSVVQTGDAEKATVSGVSASGDTAAGTSAGENNTNMANTTSSSNTTGSENAGDASDPVGQTASGGVIDASTITGITGDSENTAPSVREVLFAVWIMGAAVIAIRKSYRYLRFKRAIMRDSILDDGTWSLLLPKSVRNHIRVREAKVPSPIVFGIIHPTVLIPERTQSTDNMRYALMHEGLHVVRKDLLLRTIAEGAAVLHWFNPFAWLIRNKITQYSENACDEAVAVQLSLDERKSYALSILDFMDYSTTPEPQYPATLMSFSGEAEHVKRRLKHIMEFKTMKKPAVIFSAFIILTAAMIGSMAACSLAFSGEGTQTTSADHAITEAAMTAAEPVLITEGSTAAAAVTAITTAVPTEAPLVVDLSIFAIQPTYSYATPFSDYGFAIVAYITGPYTSYVFIDEAGKEVPKIRFTDFLQNRFDLWKKYGDFGANGYVWIENDGKWGFVNEKCQLIVEPQYDGAMPFGVNGLAGVYIDGKWGFINESGEIVIEPQFEGVQTFLDNGLCIIEKDGKYGFIDDKGNIIAEPVYESLVFSGEFYDSQGPFADNGQGLAAVCRDGKWGLLNISGTLLAKPVYDYFFSYGDNNLAVVIRDGKFGYMNEQGELVIDCKFEGAYDFNSNGLGYVCADGKWGFINEKGEYVIEPKFDEDGWYVGWFAENGLSVMKDGALYGYINESGNYVIEPQFTLATGFTAEGLAAVCIDDRWGMINESGEFVIEPKYSYIYSIDKVSPDTFAVEETNGKWGLMNSAGEYLIEPSFSYFTLPIPNSDEGPGLINRTSVNAALIMQSEKGGIISLDGRILIPPIAEQGSLIIASNGMVAVMYNGRYGYIDIEDGI